MNNPNCIDLILTNSYGSFQNTNIISSGLSDCHKLVLSVIKTTFPKAKPKQIFYRDFKNFEETIFKDDLKRCLHANTDTCVNFSKFQEVFLDVLAIHAPIKQKYIRANEVPYMTKALRKAIMTRSRLENKYLKTKSLADKDLFKKQKNYCNRLYKRERKKFYNIINLESITDNKKFWGTMKPFLTDKGVSKNNISLIEGTKIITKDSEVAEILNNYFDEAVLLLGINEPSEHLIENHHVNDPIDSILLKFSNHPSILMINAIMINSSSSFSFHVTTLTEIENEINNLDTKKSNPINSISAQHLKEHADICGNYLHNIIIFCITNSNFDDGMKLADISPVHKKDDITNKSNYRPISGLSAGSKIFGRIIQVQIGNYMETFLSPYLCGYRKGYSVQHALIALLENLRVSLDKKGYGGAILMDLSKAFDTLNHDLLIAKLHAYGFSRNALMLIKSYLSNRWQRTKINNSYSSWIELLRGVPQGSILGPLLFNIYLNDLFLIALDTDICNFADDNTLYTCDISLKDLVEKLESSATLVIEWFRNNYMKLNESKCHLLVCGNKEEVMIAKIGNATVIETHEVKLLGFNIDRDLRFKNHMESIYIKAGRKLNALARLCKFLPFNKRRVLMKAFVMSQFATSPLIGMFVDRNLNSKINALHFRALRMVYRDNISSFEDLLVKDKSLKVHHRNIHFLAIEMFKVKLGIAPSFMEDIFEKRVLPSNSVVNGLRHQSEFYNSHNPKTVYYGTETLKSLGPKIWNILPINVKNSANLEMFKRNIKIWIPTKCPCRLCRPYIPGLGFI